MELDGIANEIEFYDRYASKLRQQIEAAERELARVTRLKQQRMAELSRLRKAGKVAAT